MTGDGSSATGDATGVGASQCSRSACAVWTMRHNFNRRATTRHRPVRWCFRQAPSSSASKSDATVGGAGATVDAGTTAPSASVCVAGRGGRGGGSGRTDGEPRRVDGEDLALGFVCVELVLQVLQTHLQLISFGGLGLGHVQGALELPQLQSQIVGVVVRADVGALRPDRALEVAHGLAELLALVLVLFRRLSS